MSDKSELKIYYVANTRFPNEKAHGIQIAKTIESFIEEGREVELVVPRRTHLNSKIQEFYKLKVSIPVTYLPCIDLYNKGRLWFFLSSITFIVSYLVFFILKIIGGKKFIIYSVDMDTFSMTPLTLLPRQFFTELHGARNLSFTTKIFFRFSTGIIAINEAVKNVVVSRFIHTPPVLVEPNGVDLHMFSNVATQTEARKALALPADKQIVMFVGRFYSWKEVGILAEAAAIAPEIQWYAIGGSKDDFLRVTSLNTMPNNLIICGDKAPTEVPYWVAAADVVLALGTKKNNGSWKFTSPMKVFEYMASGRPVVASRTPALESILNEAEVYFYKPDDAVDLVEKVTNAIANQKPQAVHLALTKAKAHEWKKRAKRILEFIDSLSIN